jgi:hypothetical protein
MQNMFDNKGQINASNMADLLAQLSKVASILQENQPANIGMAGRPDLSDQAKDDLVAQAVSTEQGKIALAQSMANPIRRNLDYHGIARRALVVDALQQGSLPVYDRDIDVVAVVCSSNGTGPESRVFGDRVTVPTWELFANPTVRIAEARRRRFNVIDRAVQKARQELMAQEDANVFGAIDAAASVENTVQDIADAGMLKRDLVELKAQVDRWDLVTTKYFMNINEFTDILKWGSGGGQGVGGGEVDPVTMREVLQTGLYAHIWGADIMVSKVVPPGTVYALTDPEFVGVMPIRQDIEVLPADEPKQLKLGWVVSEEIGIAIVNPRGVAKGNKSVIIGA